MNKITIRLLDDLDKQVEEYSKKIGCSSVEVFVIAAIRSFIEVIEEADYNKKHGVK